MLVVAFGGNALQRPGELGTIDEMRASLRLTLAGLEPALRSGQPLLVTHGNGPQVGSALLRSEAAADTVPPHPLDVAGATTQGEIGSTIVEELHGMVRRLGLPSRPIVAVITHVEVDPADPRLANPTKPIGPFYEEATARSLERGRGWTMVEDSGRGWRRVVGSPAPVGVLELDTLRALLADGAVVVAAGGGGIPVTTSADGTVRGVEAVIDKDRTASLMARLLDADRLVILTAVDAVYQGFGTDAQAPIPRMDVEAARALLNSGALPAGSMAPKVEASADFAAATGRVALITSDRAFGAALDGSTGTTITR